MKKVLLLSGILVMSLCGAEQVTLKTQTIVSATGTSTLLLAANQRRKYLLIINNGSATVYAKGGSIHSSTEGVPIVAGGNWEPFQTPTDAIYLKSASGTQSVSIIEGI